jgi:hypothetical protein
MIISKLNLRNYMIMEKGILLYVSNDYNTGSSGKTSNDNKYDCDESLRILSNIDFAN